jgi:hypothetical protein
MDYNFLTYECHMTIISFCQQHLKKCHTYIMFNIVVKAYVCILLGIV